MRFKDADLEVSMNQQQQNDELGQYTEQALLAAKPFVSKDDFSLLCWIAGVTTEQFEHSKQQETNHGNNG